MRASFLILTRTVLASLILIIGYFGPAQAAKLWQILETAQKDCARVVNGLKTTEIETASVAGSKGDCSSSITRLYLNSLKDRDQQQILQTAIKDQRAVLEVAQSMVESGRGSTADILIAEVELKRLQLQEANRITARRHSKLVFEAVLAADPAEFIAPAIPAEAWPEDKAAALNALASSTYDSQVMQQRLEHAWADYEGMKRRRSLLQPMTALTQDLATTSIQWFDLGQISITQLTVRLNDVVQQKLALTEAESNLLSARLRILEILGRTSAIE